jgi:hypothetical protein
MIARLDLAIRGRMTNQNNARTHNEFEKARVIAGALTVLALLWAGIFSNLAYGKSRHQTQRHHPAWTKPALVTPAGRGGGTLRALGDLGAPYVTVLPDGTSIVVWAQGSDANCMIKARSRSVSGQLGRTQTITSRGERSVNCIFQIATSPNGTAVIVWRHNGGGSSGAGPYFVRARRSNGQLGPVQQLVNPGDQYAVLDVTIDPNGRATLLLSSSKLLAPFQTRDTIFAQRVESNGTLDPPITVADVNSPAVVYSLNPTAGSIGSDRTGDVVLTWLQANQVEGPPQLWARSLLANGTLGAPVEVVAFQASLEDPGYGVAVASDGQATFEWESPPFDFSGVRDVYGGRAPTAGLSARVMAPSGALGTIGSVTPSGGIPTDTSDQMGLAGLENGTTVAAWWPIVHAVDRRNVVRARTITAGGLGPVRTIATTSCRECLIEDYGLAAGESRSLAFWQTQRPFSCRACSGGIEYGVLGRAISSTGSLGAVQAIRTDAFTRPTSPTLAAAAIDSNGRVVVLLREPHGLYVTVGHVS